MISFNKRENTRMPEKVENIRELPLVIIEFYYTTVSAGCFSNCALLFTDALNECIIDPYCNFGLISL